MTGHQARLSGIPILTMISSMLMSYMKITLFQQSEFSIHIPYTVISGGCFAMLLLLLPTFRSVKDKHLDKLQTGCLLSYEQNKTLLCGTVA